MINILKTGQERLIVTLSGKIGIENSVEIENEIKENLEDIKELVLDFSEVVYISSAGLRMLSNMYKKMKEKAGALYVKNPNDEVKNVFQVSGFDTFINVIK